MVAPLAASLLANHELLAGEQQAAENQAEGFRLNYLLASSMYGHVYVGDVLAEVQKTGATAIDLWPKTHGNQREQLDDLGIEKFADMMREHDVTLGCITQYKLGPFGLQDEMRLAQRLGCQTIVTSANNGVKAKGLKGSRLKAAIADFIDQMKPHLAVARETGLTIAIENHAKNIIESPESLQWLAEMAPDNLAIAYAPYHLPQDETLQAELIETLGDKISIFYAWEHGNGCHTAQPKEQELLQMPARGPLDFKPLLAALKTIDFNGFTEIFMHPYPRGLMIVPGTDAVTAEINRSREYLDGLVKTLA